MNVQNIKCVNKTLQKHVKATIYTQILIFDIYLKQVERDRTSGNPGRHRGDVQTLAGRRLERYTLFIAHTN